MKAESYVGFDKLAKKVGSKALAAWIGRKKYGEKKFEKAAETGKSLRGEKPMKEEKCKCKKPSCETCKCEMKESVNSAISSLLSGNREDAAEAIKYILSQRAADSIESMQQEVMTTQFGEDNK